MIYARAFTGNEEPGSSSLLPFISRLSKISNSQGRGDSFIKASSFFTFFSLSELLWISFPSYHTYVDKPGTFSFISFKNRVLCGVYERLYAHFFSRTLAAMNYSSD